MTYNLIVGNYKRMIRVIIFFLIGNSIFINLPLLYSAITPTFNKVFPLEIWFFSSLAAGLLIFYIVLRKTYKTEPIEILSNGIKSDSLGELNFSEISRIKVPSNRRGMQNQLIIITKKHNKYVISDTLKFSDNNTPVYCEFRDKVLSSVNADVIKEVKP